MPPMPDVQALTAQLVACPSITPDDAGCQTIIATFLAALGFEIQWFSQGNVRNLWARWGSTAPLYCFAGHTDVVPPGPRADWQHDPFVATVVGEHLYGRGVADMKGGLAAMLTACAQWLEQPPQQGSLAFLITSDEEGPAQDGTRHVLTCLQSQSITINGVIIGEPTASHHAGDVIKNGRRGSLHAHLTFRAPADHVAYGALADNVIFQSLPALHAVLSSPWDATEGDFPATTGQIVAIHSDAGAKNLIPGTLSADLNWRFSPVTTPTQIADKTHACIARYTTNYTIEWTLAGMPFYTPATSPLIQAVQMAITRVTGQAPALSNAGGTSDGRFFAAVGIPVVECGLVHETIHQANEHIRIADLHRLTAIYTEILRTLF